jgi:drug/metabolite transporter superfamily protein YnfA
MTVARSLILFVAAALAEIGGAWLVWQGVREHRGWLWAGAWSSTGSGPTATTSSVPFVCLIGVGVIMYAPRDA